MTGFAVVLYDNTGTELGSDQVTNTGSNFITPGRSLTWTQVNNVIDGGSTVAMGNSDPSIPVGATTCQLVQRNHP